MSTVDTSTIDPLAEAVDRLVCVSVDLRRFADWFEEYRVEWGDAHLERPTINDGSADKLRLQSWCSSANGLASAARILAAGAPVGAVQKRQDDHFVYVARSWGSVIFEVIALRDRVCERTQVGTRTVEKPDPDAPKVTVVEPVYEWRCAPILNGAR